MNDLTTARYFCAELYKIDPDCRQISNLHKAICYKKSREETETLQKVGVASVLFLAVTVPVLLAVTVLFTNGKK